MLYPVPSDPPDDSPSCSVEPALNHTSLRLLCSWPGGFPSPSLQWTGGLEKAGHHEANADQAISPTNTAILLSSEGLTSDNRLFTCVGSHLALKHSAVCSTRACKKDKNLVFFLYLFSNLSPLTVILLHQMSPLQIRCVLPM